jgi:hypothetical protein
MRYSVAMAVADRTPRIAGVAQAVEESGLNGLRLPDHAHIPVSRQTVPGH